VCTPGASSTIGDLRTSARTQAADVMLSTPRTASTHFSDEVRQRHRT